MSEPKSMSVLLVDASSTIREWWKKVLREIPGVSVVGEASSEVEAVTLFEGLRPDTVLLDLDASLENLNVLREIRRRDPVCFLIALSNYRDEAKERMCYEYGADCYFAKAGGAEGVIAVLKARLGL